MMKHHTIVLAINLLVMPLVIPLYTASFTEILYGLRLWFRRQARVSRVFVHLPLVSRHSSAPVVL